MIEADDSTIPILFREVLLYLGFHYQNKELTQRYKILRNEFKKNVNRVDNFTFMCKDSTELFQFLAYYHEQAKKTFDLVKNFYNIAYKYQSIVIQVPEKP